MKKYLLLSIATGLFIGFAPVASGTFGTLLGIPFFFFLAEHPWYLLASTVLFFFIGVYASTFTSEYVGKKDPSCVVIDEVVGFMVACLFFKFSVLNLVCLFLLFRFFDILKNYPSNKLESLPKGWGIMLDDVMAGIYANVAFRIILWIIAL